MIGLESIDKRRVRRASGSGRSTADLPQFCVLGAAHRVFSPRAQGDGRSADSICASTHISITSLYVQIFNAPPKVSSLLDISTIQIALATKGGFGS
jgi:hypothetical protein